MRAQSILCLFLGAMGCQGPEAASDPPPNRWLDASPVILPGGDAASDLDGKSDARPEHDDAETPSRCTRQEGCEDAASTPTTCAAGARFDSERATCVTCRKGVYCNGASPEELPCSAGTWDDDSHPATPCAPCPEGVYCAGEASIPVHCALGTYDHDRSPATACAPCEAGTYCRGGAETPMSCPQGTWDHDRLASTPCLACAPGSQCDGGASVEAPCPMGTQDHDKSASTACAPCTAGSYCAGGLNEAAPCAAGKHDHDRDPSTPCRTCAVGTYCGGGAVAELACPAGTYDHDRNPATACALCDPGTYCPGGTTAPAACPKGTHDDDGSASTPCVLCASGQACPGGTASATSCPEGSHDPDGDPATACVPCAPGVYCRGGSHPMVRCEGGTVDYDHNPATACDTCGAGMYCTGGTSPPVACDVGSYCPPASPAPSPCLAGTWDDDLDPATPCRACNAGTYCQGGTLAPTSCARGTFDDDRNAATPCVLCIAGTYCVGGPELPVACPAGTWDADQNAATACAACTSGRYCAGGANPAVACPRGTTDHDQRADTPCSACQAGEYCAGENAAPTPCGSGTYDHDRNPATACWNHNPETLQALDDYFTAHGGRGAFPASYVAALEGLLLAEDEAIAGHYAAARARIDDLLAVQPWGDSAWEAGLGLAQAHVGNPIAYAGLRMVSDIADTGMSQHAATSTAIQLTIVLAECATGTQPEDTSLTTERNVNLTLSPAVAESDYAVLRQAVRLFQKYVWAVTAGRLSVELAFQSLASCVTVGWNAGPPAMAGLASAADTLLLVPSQVRRQSDMYWIIYPSNVPTDAAFDNLPIVSVGMDQYGQTPVFISDDLFLLRKPVGLGVGAYTPAERRAAMPEWFQHEFAHHLFARYPQFGLEPTAHSWSNRNSWPVDFVGSWEEDYFVEAVNKRLRSADPPLWSALRTAAPPLSMLTALPESSLLGTYHRLPWVNASHIAHVEYNAQGQLVWRTDQGDTWHLSYQQGALQWESDSPDGVLPLLIELKRDADGAYVPEVLGLRLSSNLDEFFTRVP